MSARNRDRAAWIERGRYYAWTARRREVPAGRDPLTGLEFDAPYMRRDARRLGRAARAAMARECFRIARRYPNPLPSGPDEG